MNRNLKKKVTTMLLTLALLTSSTNAVFADDWYLEDGDITVSATNAGQTVTQGDTTTDDDDPIIQNRDPDTATEHTITVKTEDDASANLTLEDVHISSDDAAIDVGSAHVVLQVSGENTLTSTEEAAIHVSDGSVTIEGDGTITVTSTINADGEAENLENCEHSYTAAITDPTCDTEGYTTYTCTHCGASYTSNTTSALGHTYTSTVTEPTCRYSGYTTYTCETCGSSYTDDYVAAVDCDYSVWTSCGEDTWRHLKVCKYCGCREGEAEDCTLVYVEFADTVYPICTACGTMGSLVLDVAEDAECRVGETTLTEDDVILYEKEEPFGWTYGNLEGYDESPLLVDRIFTVAMKDENGSLDNPEDEMTITVAYTQRYGYGGCKLLRLLDDGTWMEMAATYDRSEDTIIFTTIESGVFVIVY